MLFVDSPTKENANLNTHLLIFASIGLGDQTYARGRGLRSRQKPIFGPSVSLVLPGRLEQPGELSQINDLAADSVVHHRIKPLRPIPPASDSPRFSHTIVPRSLAHRGSNERDHDDSNGANNSLVLMLIKPFQQDPATRAGAISLCPCSSWRAGEALPTHVTACLVWVPVSRAGLFHKSVRPEDALHTETRFSWSLQPGTKKPVLLLARGWRVSAVQG